MQRGPRVPPRPPHAPTWHAPSIPAGDGWGRGGHLVTIGACIGTLGVDVHAVDRSGRTGLMRATSTECETLGLGVGETLTGIGSRRCFHTGIGAFPHQ